jgi:ribA/ribD-fused uncharacterized protein
MIAEFKEKFAWLSNFWECNIEVGGVTYSTVEHYYQSAKALHLPDRIRIATAETPGQAKRLGRKVPIRPGWEEIKLKVMLGGLEAKFKNPQLKDKLMATDQALLVEGNTWHDNYWGNCTCPKCVHKPGLNMLGRLIMSIRKGKTNE